MTPSGRKRLILVLGLTGLGVGLACWNLLLAQGGGLEIGQKLLQKGEHTDKNVDLYAEDSTARGLLQTVGGADATMIDLPSALQLAGVQNPQMLLARQRVLEAVALRQLAAAQILPSLHLGTSFDNHNGNLQQSNGNVLQVDRGNFYIGAGAHAIAAGTVAIPGVLWNLNVSETLFKALGARQLVQQQRLASRAVENAMLHKVGAAYLQLLRAEGQRVLTLQTLQDAQEVGRLTAAFAKAGQGRQADADRAATEFFHLQARGREAEGEVLVASARLAELLSLPPTPRLHPLEDKTVPTPVVPDPIPLPELLTLAMLNRPELQEQQVGIRRAMLELTNARVLPFSPTLFIGLSYGDEGGGSNLVAEPAGTTPFAKGQPRFGRFSERADFDAVMFWSLQNLGLGNLAMIREAQSHVASANLELVRKMNIVRAEVANAYARTHARFARIETAEQAVYAIRTAFAEDMRQIKGGIGRPIELLDSLRLLGRARAAYLDAILDYNLAQLDLYVALGQPPADTLARPVPPQYSPPTKMAP